MLGKKVSGWGEVQVQQRIASFVEQRSFTNGFKFGCPPWPGRPVTKTWTNDLRAFVEDHLRMEALKTRVDMRRVEAHAAHEDAVGRKSYSAKGLEELDPLYGAIAPGVCVEA